MIWMSEMCYTPCGLRYERIFISFCTFNNGQHEYQSAPQSKHPMELGKGALVVHTVQDMRAHDMVKARARELYVFDVENNFGRTDAQIGGSVL
jgi:hypothetical protein